MVLAGRGCIALEASARKYWENCILRVILKRRALLHRCRVLAKQVSWKFRVPVVLHLIVLLIKMAVERALHNQTNVVRKTFMLQLTVSLPSPLQQGQRLLSMSCTY